MLSVIALFLNHINEFLDASVIGVARHNHQRRPMVVESRFDDPINFANPIFQGALRLRIQNLVHRDHCVVDAHSALLKRPRIMGSA